MNADSITELKESGEYMCPPITDTSLVENVLKDKYGLTTVSLKPLNGYEDRNFLGKVKEEHNNPYLSGMPVKEFFIKIVNPADSKRRDYVESQRLLMRHITSLGLPAQTEIQNLDGNFFSPIILAGEGVEYTCLMSLRTFLPGTMIAEHTLTPPILYQLGAFLADLSKAFQSFKCEFYETFDCLWSLDNTLKVRSVVHVIPEERLRKIVHEILDAFETEVLPKKKEFRKGQIHGDPNEQNILVVPDSTKPSGVAISGMLDFQETACTHPIYDLAMMAAYMMMHSNTNVAPIEAAGYVLAGYTSGASLPSSERACYSTLIASRMAMSLTYGAYVYSQNPTNTYVLTTGKIGWAVLSQFWTTAKDEVEKKWDEIMASYQPK